VPSLDPARVAAQLEALLDALRLGCVDVVGAGWGARVGDALAARSPARVRRLVAIECGEASVRAAELARRRKLAASDPELLRARVFASLPASLSDALRATLAGELGRVSARNLALAYADADSRVTPFGVGMPGRVEIDEVQASDPDRLWSLLALQL
jgi:pimeloyl-ACP methyl ester carboxylesterase